MPAIYFVFTELPLGGSASCPWLGLGQYVSTYPNTNFFGPFIGLRYDERVFSPRQIWVLGLVMKKLHISQSIGSTVVPSSFPLCVLLCDCAMMPGTLSFAQSSIPSA
jgi:hypothetical protein